MIFNILNYLTKLYFLIYYYFYKLLCVILNIQEYKIIHLIKIIFLFNIDLNNYN